MLYTNSKNTLPQMSLELMDWVQPEEELGNEAKQGDQSIKPTSFSGSVEISDSTQA